MKAGEVLEIWMKILCCRGANMHDSGATIVTHPNRMNPTANDTQKPNTAIAALKAPLPVREQSFGELARRHLVLMQRWMWSRKTEGRSREAVWRLSLNWRND